MSNAKLKRGLVSIYEFTTMFGFNPLKLFNAIRGLPLYIVDMIKLNRSQKKIGGAEFPIAGLYPVFDDIFAASGTATGHYFHQDLLIARKIFKAQPVLHIDVGSRIDGFVAHVASFRTITIADIRPLNNQIENVSFIQADFMSNLPSHLLGACDSLSCLHALEHFGLGRYGDPIMWNGYLLGFENLHKMLKQNGILYFSVPIGRQRIEFNAHRVFSVKYLMDMISGKFEIEEFSYVNDKGDLFENVVLDEQNINTNFGCTFGCGIFSLRKV